jgi:quinol monooxygenase YgiN
MADLPWPDFGSPIAFPRSQQIKTAQPMTTISKDTQLATLINVFTVEPDKQQQLVDLLIHATDVAMRHVPGFISANIHRSLDGTKVVNYAQWRSVEHFQAMMKNPAAKPHMEQVAAIAKFEPALYEVVETCSNATENA